MNYSDKKCANCLKVLVEDEDRCFDRVPKFFSKKLPLVVLKRGTEVINYSKKTCRLPQLLVQA